MRHTKTMSDTPSRLGRFREILWDVTPIALLVLWVVLSGGLLSVSDSLSRPAVELYLLWGGWFVTSIALVIGIGRALAEPVLEALGGGGNEPGE